MCKIADYIKVRLFLCKKREETPIGNMDMNYSFAAENQHLIES